VAEGAGRIPTSPDPLPQVDDWGPDTVAVGVTDGQDTLGAHGPVDRGLPLASVTKPLTAYAVLVAARDGLVHLDEPAGPYGPQGVTVRHLLAHAGGLPPDEGGAVIAPGRRRIYSNWGYELLGELVARRVGTPFDRHLEVEVLEPLGMHATRLEGSPAHAGIGSVRDLLAFARELLAPQLVDAALVEEATTTVLPGLDGVLPGYGRQTPNDWGLGFEIKDAKLPHWTGDLLAASTFGHFGRSGSFLWVDPEHGLACASVCDLAFGDWAIQAWPPFSDAVLEAYAG